MICDTCNLDFCPLRGQGCAGHWQKYPLTRPLCEVCDDSAVGTLNTPYQIESEFGMTFTGFDAIAVCGDAECQAEAERIQAL